MDYVGVQVVLAATSQRGGGEQERRQVVRHARFLRWRLLIVNTAQFLARRTSLSYLHRSSFTVSLIASCDMGIQASQKITRFIRSRRRRTRRSVQGFHRKNRGHDHIRVQVRSPGRCRCTVGVDGVQCSEEWLEFPEHCASYYRGT